MDHGVEDRVDATLTHSECYPRRNFRTLVPGSHNYREKRLKISHVSARPNPSEINPEVGFELTT